MECWSLEANIVVVDTWKSWTLWNFSSNESICLSYLFSSPSWVFVSNILVLESFFRQEKNGWLTGWFLFRTNSPRPAVEPGQFDGSTGNIRFIDVNSRKYPRKHTWKPSKSYKWTICTIQFPPTDIEACLIFRNPPDNYNTGTNRLSVHTLDTVSTIHTRDKNIPYYGMILGTYELITSNQDLILDDDLN